MKKAKIVFEGMCTGTQKKNSKKSGNDYFVTGFVEVPSLKPFEVFGDLGLPAVMVPTHWELEGVIVNLSSVSVIAGAAPSGASAGVKSGK